MRNAAGAQRSTQCGYDLRIAAEFREGHRYDRSPGAARHGSTTQCGYDLRIAAEFREGHRYDRSPGAARHGSTTLRTSAEIASGGRMVCVAEPKHSIVRQFERRSEE